MTCRNCFTDPCDCGILNPHLARDAYVDVVLEDRDDRGDLRLTRFPTLRGEESAKRLTLERAFPRARVWVEQQDK